MGKIGTIVGVVVAGAFLAGGVAMSVQESRNWILDEIAKTSNIHKTVVTERDNLKIEIDELKNQKETLLISLTELDNQINSTEDEVTLESLVEKKTAILAQVETLNSRIAELENKYGEYVININDITSISYSKLSVPEGQFQMNNCKLGNMSFQKQIIKDELLDLKPIQFATGKFIDIEDVGGLPHFTNYYNVTDDCEYIPEIYDNTGRLVSFDELNDTDRYALGVTFTADINEDNTVSKIYARIDLVDEITSEVATLTSGTYRCENTEVKDYFVVDSENGTVNYYYGGEVLNEGTFSFVDGHLKMVITDSEIDCSIVENGFIFGEYTFVFQTE